MTGPVDYPDSWKRGGMPQAASPAAPIEAIMLAIDSFVAALSDSEFRSLMERTRGH